MADPGSQPDGGPRRSEFAAAPDSRAEFGTVAAGPAGSGFMPGLAAPSSAGEALQMALTGLGWLARADMASAPGPVQAECLRGLERLQSFQTAARASALAAFTAQGGYEDDGQGSPRTWLTWQTKITRPAASAAIASMRRLREHAAIHAALAEGTVSASWARQIAEWADLLPAGARADADVILLAAARGGADLPDLAQLAEEIRRRTARPDREPGDGFEDRSLRLATTLGGAGRLHGDLTGRCAAALAAVLESLGKKAGPEDTRTRIQRDHDALEEALRRLLASGCLPDRAGQPVQLQLHLTLDQLLNGAGLPAGHDGPSGPAQDVPAAGPGDDCDAAVAPIITGRVDHDLLDRFAGQLTRQPGRRAECGPGRPCGARCHPAAPDQDALNGELSKACARELILKRAVALLSGPGGLASWLRTGTLPKPAASISLPLDIGAVTEFIPPHLRRAIITRDGHCAAPGCDQPPAACHIHHIVPRSQGGATSLTNCILLCSFHHLIMVHRWGWTIALNPDGTTTATSPRGRTLHSHSPPATAA